jgi:hypothetical protein
MIFAELQNRHGKFGVLGAAALSSTHYERGPLDIAKQLTSTSIGIPATVLY